MKKSLCIIFILALMLTCFQLPAALAETLTATTCIGESVTMSYTSTLCPGSVMTSDVSVVEVSVVNTGMSWTSSGITYYFSVTYTGISEGQATVTLFDNTYGFGMGSISVTIGKHHEVTDPAVEATCTETGLTEGKHCDICGKVFVAQEVIPSSLILESVRFSKGQAEVKENITVTAVTSADVTKLSMYSGSTLAKSWTTGYTDNGNRRTWKVTYAFGSAGKDRKLTFRGQDANGASTKGKDAVITINPAIPVGTITFSKSTATVNQNVTITAVTPTTATKLAMYSGGTMVKSWTSGYTDGNGKRTWKVTYAFAGAGNRTLSFKASDANGVTTAEKEASITVTAAPTLSSVAFSKASATVNQNVTITAVTNTTASKLTMYNNGSAVKSWTSGYTDSNGKRTWKVTYAFAGAGNRTLSFKASDANGVATAEKEASITVTAAPTLSSVAFSKASATVNQSITITAVTNTTASKLTMYNNGSVVKSWTTGYTDSNGKRTWKITYAFAGAGNRTLSFKAFDANGIATAEKEASITVTAAPTLSSVAFSKASAAVNEEITITAVTNTSVSKLTMYNNGSAVKSWTSGYTDSNGKRTWKVTYAFAGAGNRTLSFKAFDANGIATAEKTASITVTK